MAIILGQEEFEVCLGIFDVTDLVLLVDKVSVNVSVNRRK